MAKNPSGAKFLAPGSKSLPKSYFQNVKGNGKVLKKGKAILDTNDMRKKAGSPQQNVMGVGLLQGGVINGVKKLQSTGSVKTNSSDILNENLNQGFGKGQKGLSVRRTSDGYMRKK